MGPVLHEQHTGPVYVQNLDRRDERILSVFISLWPNDAFQPYRRSDDDLAVVEATEVGELLLFMCELESDSEEVILIFDLF